jgi:hypothetical protein
MQADKVAGLDLDSVPLDDPHERTVVDDHAAFVTVPVEVD